MDAELLAKGYFSATNLEKMEVSNEKGTIFADSYLSDNGYYTIICECCTH